MIENFHSILQSLQIWLGISDNEKQLKYTANWTKERFKAEAFKNQG